MRARYLHRAVRQSMADGQYTQAAEQLTGGVRRRPEELAMRTLGMVGCMLDPDADALRPAEVLDRIDRLLRALEKRALEKQAGER